MIFKWKRYVLTALLWLTLDFAYAQYHTIDSLENLLNRPADTIKANIQNSIARSFLSLDTDKAIQMALESRDLSQKLKFKDGELNALRTLSDVYIRKGDLGNALSINKQCVALANSMGDKNKIAMARGFLGMSYRYMSYHSKAFEELSAAVELFHELGDRENEASFSLSIGNIYLGEKNYAMARKYYEKAIAFSDNDANLKYVVLINLAEIDQEEQHYEKSFDTLDKALTYFEKREQTMYIAYILYLKGKGYHALSDMVRATAFYQRALGLYNQMQNSSGQARCLIELGNIDLLGKKTDSALAHFHHALALVKEQHKYVQLEKIYLGLVEAYKTKNDFKQSLDNQILAGICQDSLRAMGQREKLTELQARYENDIAEKEISQLKAERQDYNMMMGLLSLLVVSGGVIISLTFRRHKHSLKIAEVNRKELQSALAAKEEIARNLETELQFKVKELTSFALNMIQKKEILEGIKKGMEEIREHIEGDARAKLNKILSTINLSQRLDKDWENFKLYFEQVHQGFFDNLTANFPDLNANDIRLCALIRLNLDTKQIASVMDIAPESAKVAKHRIRKKLGLSNNDNLNMFFANLGQVATAK